MTGTPTRTPGEGGWIHTQGKRLLPKRRARAADPGHAPRPATGDRRSERPAGGPGHTAVNSATRPDASWTPAGQGPGLTVAVPISGRPRAGSASTDEGGFQILIDGRFRYPEGSSDADRF